MTDINTSQTYSYSDPTKEQLQQVETLLAITIDSTGSSLENALTKLITGGGKRIRPLITLLMGSIFGINQHPILRLAAAVELLHTASLIHDDIFDKAMLRRGVATINAHWSTTTSILAGDLVLTKAISLIQETKSTQVIQMFIETMNRMVSGELSYLAHPKKPIDKESYFTWISAKTAALFELAAGAPAYLGKTGATIISSACHFGYHVGIAFQIIDDVLDFNSTTTVLGKPVGSDLRRGILTLPALLYLDTHTRDSDLQTIIAGKKLDELSFEHLLTRICTSDAIEEAMDHARNFVCQGLEELTCLPDVPERLSLIELAESIIVRNK